MTDQQTTDRLTAEELKYSHNRARRRQRPTNNLLEVWQNSAPFSGRPIGAAVEALLTIVVNWRSVLSPIGFVFVAAARAAVSVRYLPSVITIPSKSHTVGFTKKKDTIEILIPT